LLSSFRGSAVAVLAVVAALFLASPAVARDSYVRDNAGLFSAATVASLNQKIGDFHAQTGKEVVVVTVPSLNGASVQDAAQQTFAQEQVNGILIFLAKAEQKDGIIGDRASTQFFPAGTFDDIRADMRGYFQNGDYDQGIVAGVNAVLDQYRSHERALGTSRSGVPYAPVQGANTPSTGGGMSLFWLIVVLVAGFLIIRALFRAITRPRVYPPGYGSPGSGPGPGYGVGYGGPGFGYGGGGFFSGLLGGLGGAWLGSELFGRQNVGYVDPNAASAAGLPGGDPGSGFAGDSAGWQADPGQADMGNASFGDFGSSGGGFDAGGGGDMGGGW